MRIPSVAAFKLVAVRSRRDVNTTRHTAAAAVTARSAVIEIVNRVRILIARSMRARRRQTRAARIRRSRDWRAWRRPFYPAKPERGCRNQQETDDCKAERTCLDAGPPSVSISPQAQEQTRPRWLPADDGCI